MNGRLGPLPKHLTDAIESAVGPGPTGEIRLTLPMPPTTNHYWAHFLLNGKPRIGLSGVGSRYRKAVAEAVALAGRPKLHAGRVDVVATLYPQNRQRWDLDNRLKPLLDALVEAGVMADDSLIDHLAIHRGSVSPRPRAEVVIRAVPEAGLFAEGT